MKKNRLTSCIVAVSLVVGLLLTSCAAPTIDYENIPKTYGEVDIILRPDFQIQKVIDSEMRSGGRILSLKPVEYRFYQRFVYLEEEQIWSVDGYADCICEIVDEGASGKNDAKRENGSITLREDIDLRFQYEDEQDFRNILQRLGFSGPELTEAELSAKKPLVREYRVPDDMIRPDLCTLHISNFVGFLEPGNVYDVLVMSWKGNDCARYASLTQLRNQVEDSPSNSDYRAYMSALFREYLSKNQASLGLAPIEAEK